MTNMNQLRHTEGPTDRNIKEQRCPGGLVILKELSIRGSVKKIFQLSGRLEELQEIEGTIQ